MKHAAAIRLFAEWCLEQPDLTGFHVATWDHGFGVELILDWGDYHTLRRVSRMDLEHSQFGDTLLVFEAEDMAITARRELADRKAKVARRYLP